MEFPNCSYAPGDVVWVKFPSWTEFAGTVAEVTVDEVVLQNGNDNVVYRVEGYALDLDADDLHLTQEDAEQAEED